MIEKVELSGYKPLEGNNPELKPECWVIFYQRDLLLPEQGVVWHSKPAFLAGGGEQALVTGYWAGKAVGVIHLDMLDVDIEPVSVRTVLMTSEPSIFPLLSHRYSDHAFTTGS